MKKCKPADLLISIIFAELTGALSGILAGDISGVYGELVQPPLSPPGWVFPLAWAVLYALMGISACLIKTSGEGDTRGALAVYYVQLFLNFMWSIVFFRFRLFWAAAILLFALLTAVLVMIVKFSRLRPAAGYLNILYVLWLCFAAYLNLGTAALN